MSLRTLFKPVAVALRLAGIGAPLGLAAACVVAAGAYALIAHSAADPQVLIGTLVLHLLAVYLMMGVHWWVRQDVRQVHAACRDELIVQDHRRIGWQSAALSGVDQALGHLLREFERRQRELAERLAEIAHATQELHQSADVVADSASGVRLRCRGGRGDESKH
ncbi:MAG: hypothetical protein LPK85_08705 [Gammaproteobacteria bacterium]|nr:hypothetical protein [Gammaproteobacteria bacterium]